MAILESIDDPTVMSARSAYRATVDRLQDGKLLSCSNYADKQFEACMWYMAESEKLTPELLDDLYAAYAALMDAYAPFQPSAEVMATPRTSVPWDAPDPTPGQVFYFLPGAGGYWVAGKEKMKEECDAVRAMLVAAAL